LTNSSNGSESLLRPDSICWVGDCSCGEAEGEAAAAESTLVATQSLEDAAAAASFVDAGVVSAAGCGDDCCL